MRSLKRTEGDMKAKTLERITQLENEVHTLKCKHLETLEVLSQVRDYMTIQYFNTADGKAEADKLLAFFDFDNES